MRRVLLIALIVLSLDQATKALVVDRLPLGASWAPWPDLAYIFQFTHTTNSGMAFGLFQGGSTILTIAALATVALLLGYARRVGAAHPLLLVALGLILGGALGNLTDRLTRGAVVDFIDVGPFWIFNVADSGVVVGGILLALSMWHLDSPAPAPVPPTETQEMEHG